MNEIPTPEQIREMLPEVKPPVFNCDECRRVTLALIEEYERHRLDAIRVINDAENLPCPKCELRHCA